ncbi:MAG: hypothetical protein ACI4I6_00990 [Hominimerdicola sp.]
MIYQTKNINSELLESLKLNNYTRRIKSHFAAYGTEYDFCRFYIIEHFEEKFGVISVFNSSMIISSMQGKWFDRNILKELAGFILMIKPMSIEFENEYVESLEKLTKTEYSGDKRTEFAFVSKNTMPEMDVNETPKLDDVFKILATCFPVVKNSYELWLTDTSHRIRRGLAQSFLLGNYSTATIQYIVDKVALVGHVGTIPEERGKFHARQLLYWIGERLTKDGFEVRLFARPHRVSYYEEIGFKACGVDLVLERKNIDD